MNFALRFLRRDTYMDGRFQLSFYRNMTIHLFISEAIVSASVHTHIARKDSREANVIAYPSLQSRVSFLSQLFRGEFIFPTEGLTTNLGKTITNLESDGVLKVNRNPTEIESVELSQSERQRGCENFDFYGFLIWPFIEASWLGAVSLMMLTPPAHVSDDSRTQWLDARIVQARAQLLGKTLFAQGDLFYFEAVNRETLKNAYQRFEEEGILASRKPPKDSKGPPQVLQLQQAWLPRRDEQGELQPRGRLWEFSEEVNKSRLEGNSYVARILRLLESVGKGLWEEAAVDATEGFISTSKPSLATEEEEKDRQERRRRAPLRTRASL